MLGGNGGKRIEIDARDERRIEEHVCHENTRPAEDPEIRTSMPTDRIPAASHPRGRRRRYTAKTTTIAGITEAAPRAAMAQRRPGNAVSTGPAPKLPRARWRASVETAACASEKPSTRVR